MLTQTAGAFGQVQGSLSWFVDSYTQLADWKAVVDRLTTFGEAMVAAKRADRRRGFDVARRPGPSLELDGVDVPLPDGDALLQDVDLSHAPRRAGGGAGPSGSGKTTLFRVLAGLWPFGRGASRRPKGTRVLFLPQKPYLPDRHAQGGALLPRSRQER